MPDPTPTRDPAVAAIKFGVGRYLYRVPAQWVDYDPARKALVNLPQLPAFATPPDARPAAAGPRTSQPPAPATLPTSGPELLRRLHEYDARLAAAGVTKPGAVVSHVAAAGAKNGYSLDLAEWTAPAITFAVDCVRAYEQTIRAARPAVA